MLLSTALFIEFTKFIQVFLMILLPVLLLSVGVTVFLHYRRKRNKDIIESDEETELDIAVSSPENFCYKTGDGKFIYLDHTGLLEDFRRKLSYSNARYAALEQDFRKMKSTISDDNKTRFSNHKNNNMEQSAENMFPDTENDFKNANEEITHQEKQAMEYSCLKDLLEEKKTQISFLQNQIDLRIRSYHESEKGKSKIVSELEELRQIQQSKNEELDSLKGLLADREGEIEKIRLTLQEKENQFSENQQIVKSKTDQIIYLENILQELKEQNQVLNASVADSNERYEAVRGQLEAEESRSIAAEQKLLANKQLLQRLYKEFSSCINEEISTAPVITLRSDYIEAKTEWDEKAVH
jgi:chromosome segregation ATPase